MNTRVVAAIVVANMATTIGVAQGYNFSTLVEVGQLALTNPSLRSTYFTGVAVDGTGSMYVAQAGRNAVYKLSPPSGLSVFAGAPVTSGSMDGAAADARFMTRPELSLGVAADAAGNVFVADEGNCIIRKIAPDGRVTTLAGKAGVAGSEDGVGSEARFRQPLSLCVHSDGDVYVVDRWETIRRITSQGAVSTLAKVPGSSSVAGMSGIAVDRSRNVFVACYDDVVRKITPTGEVTVFAGRPGFPVPRDGKGGEARFNFSHGWFDAMPVGLAVDAFDNLFVADPGNGGRIRRITPEAEVTTVSPGQLFYWPTAIAVDRASNLYVADAFLNSKIFKGTPSSTFNGIVRPPSRTVALGSAAVFTLEATGSGLTYQWAKDGTPVIGATQSSLSISSATASDAGAYTCRVTDWSGVSASFTATLTVVAAELSRLSNLSIRATIAREAPLIADFTVGPDSAGTLLVRAVGPSLSAYGVATALADPKFTLFDARGMRVAENDDFSAAVAETFSRAGAFPLRAGAKDAAVVTTLPPGRYTARVEGDSVGSVLLEIFDAEGGTPQILNLTTRATIASGADTVITGVTVSPGTVTRRLLIRAIGPTLTSFGAAESEVLPNPIIEVYEGRDKVAENYNWSETSTEPYHYPFSLTDAFAKSGAFTLPLSSRDAALVHEFLPGSYTVVVRNQGEGRGNVMVEVLPLPPPPPSTLFPAGVLGLVDFTVSVRKVGDLYEYSPRVRVKEIGGVWSAFIGELLWTAEYDGGEEVLPRWNLQRRVQVASSADFPEPFSPYVGRPFQSPREFTRFRVRIPYSDDDLAGLTIEAVARVIR